jgi:hypothetical protein
MKKQFALFLFLSLAVLTVQAQQSEVFAPGGKAIKGFDPVAFFTDAKPVMGADSLAYKWKEANWLFSTKEHLDAFKANPEKYAPQYGGYCAYGSSQGHKAPTQTDTWTIVGDKLYFNYNQKVKDMWTKNQDTLIRKADLLWPEFKSKP